jgi:hypothetical protein
VAKHVIHIEKKRSRWDSSSTTLCGLKIPKVEVSGWLLTVTCDACKRIEKAS